MGGDGEGRGGEGGLTVLRGKLLAFLSEAHAWFCHAVAGVSRKTLVFRAWCLRVRVRLASVVSARPALLVSVACGSKVQNLYFWYKVDTMQERGTWSTCRDEMLARLSVRKTSATTCLCLLQ